jgi:hypothetical protein
MRRIVATSIAVFMFMTAAFSGAYAKPLNIPVVYYKLPNGL